MERPKNSRVKHGTVSCVRYGCEKVECREARRKADREMYHSKEKVMVPSEEVRLHVTGLVNAGMSPIDIANRSGVSDTQVRRLVRGALKEVFPITAESLLGVSMPDEGHISEADGIADATGARRRLQALAVQGFSSNFLAAEGGLGKNAIKFTRSGRQQRVYVSTIRIVLGLHEKFWDADPLDFGIPVGAVERAKLWSRKNGWLPTEAWTDIDDPDCKPVLSTPKYVRLAEDYRELTEEQGYDRRKAAERLGVTVDGLNAALGYYRKRMASA